MGQKVNPIGIRLGFIKPWKSVWFSNSKTYAANLLADLKARQYIVKALKEAAVSDVLIERSANNVKVTVHSARPGVIIGKRGEDVEKIKSHASKIFGVPVQLNIEEIKRPDLDASLVGQSIAQQLEKRVMFRRAMKRAVQSAMKAGAKGIKICVSGRVGGAEIARTEWVREGRVPLHTFRADIDYATAEALTTFGIIGVKVWIFKGEILGNSRNTLAVEEQEVQRERAPRHKKREKVN